MSEFISNTSPLLYLYRIDALSWLPILCNEVQIPQAVAQELSEGRQRGYDVPDPQSYEWLKTVDPRVIPPEWLNRLPPVQVSILPLRRLGKSTRSD